MEQTLFEAARRGDLSALREAASELLREFETYPYTVWAAALEADQVPALDLCLESGLDPNGTEETRPLVLAASHRARACVARLLAVGADPTLADESGRSLFNVAVMHGEVEWVRAALQSGANPFDETIAWLLRSAPAPMKKMVQDARKEARQAFAKQRRILAQLKAGAEIEPATAEEIVAPIPFAKGTTLLHVAAKGNRASVLREFLGRGADFDARDRSAHERKYGRGTTLELSTVYGGRTPLMIASIAGAVEAARVLIEAGADVHATDSAGETALHMACREKRADVVRLLLAAGANPNALTVEHGSSLLLTGYFGTVEIARALVEAGAEVDRADLAGITPFLAACWEGRTEIAEYLLSLGAKVPQSGGEEGDVWDALHIGRRTQTLRRLIGHLDVNAGSRSESPLATAGQFHHLEAIPMMVEAGAVLRPGERLNVVDAWNASSAAKRKALDALSKMGVPIDGQSVVSAVWQGDRNLVRHLAKLGADMNPGLAHASDVGFVDQLLELGADIDYQDENGRTALMAAVERGDSVVAMALLEHGANPDLEDSRGLKPADLAMTGDPAMQAVFANIPSDAKRTATLKLEGLLNDYTDPKVDEVVALLAEGADPNARAGRNEPILALAAARRLWPVVDTLLNHGAERTWEFEAMHRVRELPNQVDDAFLSAVANLEEALGEPMNPVTGGFGSVVFRLQAQVKAKEERWVAEGMNATVANLRAGFETAQEIAGAWRPRFPSLWCGPWRSHPVANPGLLLVPTSDPYTVIALICPHAGEHEIGVFEILRFLRKHEDLGWRLVGIGYDTVDLEFDRLPADIPSFAKELYEFCPDLIYQNFESLERLEEHLATHRSVHLWWD